ncbi:MAG TPA: UDP-N-acetylglucosamine 2-epimerase (non-hydrolyzing) [Candidatus Acidoferrales bacterium]|nr:UDP-N-acetylglucosamine 2-epimerase (non-hydrolyzing) [Candidatus Acidoferrales bacterium]
MAHQPLPRLLFVAGARPNFVKLAPLVAAVAPAGGAPRAEVHLVHTGQHYDEAMSRLFFEQLALPRPDVNLEVGSGAHGAQTALILERLEQVVVERRPDAVVVVGDVNSTLAGALVAAKLNVPVAHVEAGLRSFDRGMPEEINRVLTDQISHWLFVTEPSGVENLRREGRPEAAIHLVGNVMIDALRRFLPVARKTGALAEWGLEGGGGARPFVLVTLHRPSNVDAAETLGPLVEGLAGIAREAPVLFPVHPRTVERLERFGLGRHFSGAWNARGAGLRTTPPLGYLEFLHLESCAAAVVTDSGGMQEETTALGVPCFTLRDSTERPITIEQGTNTLVGSDVSALVSSVREALAGRGKRGRVPELWDGHAGERIATILLRDLSAAMK